ncbi:hydrogenase expression/formation protein HypE [Desulfallas thermosapovorans]|uniref:Hydrogenase expression/formation protein HypE n=1 Tax=Desulfallas thermosapovorans DSM 6562 TaxID=1121431 RepID=A0A5S4ZRX3_9FIRM|nr:hydrogenase expression/formation protein HypE [Desulfallas thermosapovorans]TYO95406.1 hydrogenase expression/formation protein HypE [Desulfallas thermosapovorans DSM 6562]
MAVVLLAHGDGGLLTRELVEGVFLKYFNNPQLRQLSDSAVLSLPGGRLAMTTDAFVVEPIFFPGGDIGKLAVCGTVNDLAVSGALPLYMTASFTIEEGFRLADLERVVASMAAACTEAGVEVVAGDTKVVPRGHVDKLFITTAGVGLVPEKVDWGYHRPVPGDAVLVNGSLGNHGLTVLAARENLGLDGALASDCAPLNNIIKLLQKHCPGIKMMRDLTRGGLATAAKEIAEACGLDICLQEEALPLDPVVRGAADILGLDPLYLANEGKFLAIIDPAQAAKAVDILSQNSYGRNARVIGEVCAGSGNVYLQTPLGGTRLLSLQAGQPLPRIC